MRNICCLDCDYCAAEHDYDIEEDFYWCTAGSVLIYIDDPLEMHNCSQFEPCK